MTNSDTTLIKEQSSADRQRGELVSPPCERCDAPPLAALHVLSPEFSPSWRVVSEYALGHYGWILSLRFLSWGIGSWALAVAIRSQVHTNAGRVGLWFLFIAGIGEAMASIFDITRPVGHGIAGFLGVIGFPSQPCF